MYMYYLLSFKLLRRKNGGLQYKTKFETEFIGFSEFLKSLPEDKKISVGKYINKKKKLALIYMNF